MLVVSAGDDANARARVRAHRAPDPGIVVVVAAPPTIAVTAMGPGPAADAEAPGVRADVRRVRRVSGGRRARNRRANARGALVEASIVRDSRYPASGSAGRGIESASRERRFRDVCFSFRRTAGAARSFGSFDFLNSDALTNETESRKVSSTSDLGTLPTDHFSADSSFWV